MLKIYTFRNLVFSLGKCANSLLASAGIPLIARQMKVEPFPFLFWLIFWANSLS
jgi:hypothetical protein